MNIKRTSSLKHLRVKNMCIYRGVRKKWGLSYTNEEKLGQSYTLYRKKGANHIPGSAEKGGHSARTHISTMPYIGSYTPPPPAPPRTPEEMQIFMDSRVLQQMIIICSATLLGDVNSFCVTFLWSCVEVGQHSLTSIFVTKIEIAEEKHLSPLCGVILRG